MPVMKYDDIAMTEISAPEIKNITKARVITEEHGWDGHCLRVFRIAPQGYTPLHSHDWEHVIHVIRGQARVEIDGELSELTERDFAYVPPNSMHQFTNPYDAPFEFICIVPKKGDN